MAKLDPDLVTVLERLARTDERTAAAMDKVAALADRLEANVSELRARTRQLELRADRDDKQDARAQLAWEKLADQVGDLAANVKNLGGAQRRALVSAEIRRAAAAQLAREGDAP
jgi:hypothetical protein